MNTSLIDRRYATKLVVGKAGCTAAKVLGDANGLTARRAGLNSAQA
jgi:hypothetical protein